MTFQSFPTTFTVCNSFPPKKSKAPRVDSDMFQLVGGLEHFLFFHILGMSSSQLTFIFFRGVGQPPTSQLSSQNLETFAAQLPLTPPARKVLRPNGRGAGQRANAGNEGSAVSAASAANAGSVGSVANAASGENIRRGLQNHLRKPIVWEIPHFKKPLNEGRLQLSPKIPKCDSSMAVALVSRFLLEASWT